MTKHYKKEKVWSESDDILFMIHLSSEFLHYCCDGTQLLVVMGKGIFKPFVIQSVEIMLELV